MIKVAHSNCPTRTDINMIDMQKEGNEISVRNGKRRIQFWKCRCGQDVLVMEEDETPDD